MNFRDWIIQIFTNSKRNSEKDNNLLLYLQNMNKTIYESNNDLNKSFIHAIGQTNDAIGELKTSMEKEFKNVRIDAGFTIEIAVRNQVTDDKGPNYASKIDLATVPSIVNSYFNNNECFPNELDFNDRNSNLDSHRCAKIVDHLLVIYII